MRTISRPTIPLMTLAPALLFGGCADPFATSYYHLDAPRIVALRADAEGGAALKEGASLTAHALVYEQGFFPATRALTLSWFIPPAPTAEAVSAYPVASLLAGGVAVGEEGYLGEGPDCAITVTAALAERLPASGEGVIAAALTGEVDGVAIDARALLRLPTGEGQGNPHIGALSRATLPELDIDADGALPDPSLWAADVRRELDATASGEVIPLGAVARLTAEVADPEGDELSLSWLAAPGEGGDGALLPLRPYTLDWASADLTEGEDGVDAQRLPPGRHTFVAVATDGRGGSDVRLVDVDVSSDGAPPAGLSHPLLLKSGERLIWGDAASAEAQAAVLTAGTGLVSAIFVADGDAPGLVRLDAVGPAPDPLPEGDPFGLGVCRYGGFIDGPLSLDDLARGRCVTEELLGEAVVLAAVALPGGEVSP